MIEMPEITSADVAEHYDELDEYYRRLWCDHLHHGLWLNGRESIQVAVEQLIEQVARPLEVSAGERLCDIGCGYGATSRYLVNAFGVRVTGLTISLAQYNYAISQTAGLGNPNFLLENWEENSLASESLDAAISIECVSHVVNKACFFDQLHRVLKPGKRASLTIWLSGPRPRSWQERHLLTPICSEGRLPSMGSEAEYRALIELSGFTIVAYHDLSRSVRKTWAICCRRVIYEFFASQESRQFLRSGRHSVFARTVARILVAYYSGAMQYGHFVIEKP